MDPLNSEFDPWRDTNPSRAPEREDPFEDGSVEGPFGTSSELVGVPRMAAGSRTRGTFARSRIATTGILALMAAVIVGGVLWGLYVGFF